MSNVATQIQKIEQAEKHLISALFKDIPTLQSFKIYGQRNGNLYLASVNNVRWNAFKEINLELVLGEFWFASELMKSWLIEANIKEEDIILIAQVAQKVKQSPFLYVEHCREKCLNIEEHEQQEKDLIKNLFREIPTLQRFKIYGYDNRRIKLGQINATRRPGCDIDLKEVAQKGFREYLDEDTKAWLVEANLREQDIVLLAKTALRMKDSIYLYLAHDRKERFCE